MKNLIKIGVVVALMHSGVALAGENGTFTVGTSVHNIALKAGGEEIAANGYAFSAAYIYHEDYKMMVNIYDDADYVSRTAERKIIGSEYIFGFGRYSKGFQFTGLAGIFKETMTSIKLPNMTITGATAPTALRNGLTSMSALGFMGGFELGYKFRNGFSLMYDFMYRSSGDYDAYFSRGSKEAKKAGLTLGYTF